MKPRLAILVSGGGTTAEAVILASLDGTLDAEVTLVICSRKDAGILERVVNLNKQLNLNIECLLINSSTHPAAADEIVAQGCQTVTEQAAIIETIRQNSIDVIALLGYMKRVGPEVVKAFGWRTEYTSPYQATMLNTHPGLLPESKGMYGIHVQQHVLDKKLPFSGQTLHIVAEDYDDGPILAEHQVPVESGDDAEKLFDRVREAEKYWVPRDINAFIKARQHYLTEVDK